MNENRTKHELVTGVKQNGKIIRTYIAGNAYLYEGSDYYVVNLLLFPEKNLFVKKDAASRDKYTVFARCYKQDGKFHFKSPVGNAYLNEDLKTHLEIYLPLLSRRIFMSLYPSH